MHLKNICRMFVLLLLPLLGQAQIDKEIATFVDSTEQIVNKGRILLAKHLSNKNFKKAQEVYDYLEQSTKTNPLAAFTYHEAIYINIATQNWQKVSDMMLEYPNLYRKETYHFEYMIQAPVYDHIQNNKDTLINSFQKSSIDKESKALLNLLFYYIANETADIYYTQNLKYFKSKYSESPYITFANSFLPAPIYKVGVAFNVGSGAIVPTAKLAQSYKASATFGMGLDINVNKVYTSLYFRVAGPKVKEAFTGASETHDIDFIKNETFIYFCGGVKVGYFLLRNDYLHMAGYGNIGYSSLTSNRFWGEDTGASEYRAFNSFSAGAGLHTEVKLMTFGEQGQYIEDAAYLSLKVDFGYDIIFNVNDDRSRGNVQYIGVGLSLGMGYF